MGYLYDLYEIFKGHILLCSKNKWTTGDIWVQGNSNLVAGNIKKGVNIFGITGTCYRSRYTGYFTFLPETSKTGVVERGPDFSKIPQSTKPAKTVVENGWAGEVAINWGKEWSITKHERIDVRTAEPMWLPANAILEFDMTYWGISGWNDVQRKNSIGNGYHVQEFFATGDVTLDSDYITVFRYVIWLSSGTTFSEDERKLLGGARAIPHYRNLFPAVQSEPVTDPPSAYRKYTSYAHKWGTEWRCASYVDHVATEPAFKNTEGNYYLFITIDSTADNAFINIRNISSAI